MIVHHTHTFSVEAMQEKESPTEQPYSILPVSYTHLWEFDRPKKSKLHPTMKTLPLIAYPIRMSSQENGIILDLFGGSGSTLIASEQTNRICYTQELDPKYASAIIRRYIAAVGSADGVYVLRNGVKYPCSEVHEFSADELNIQDSNVNDAQRGRE